MTVSNAFEVYKHKFSSKRLDSLWSIRLTAREQAKTVDLSRNKRLDRTRCPSFLLQPPKGLFHTLCSSILDKAILNYPLLPLLDTSSICSPRRQRVQHSAVLRAQISSGRVWGLRSRPSTVNNIRLQCLHTIDEAHELSIPYPKERHLHGLWKRRFPDAPSQPDLARHTAPDITSQWCPRSRR